jgi:hypothetical protein
MRSTLGSHLRRHAVAYLALFVALGGTAVAAKPMITGADILDASLTGADVENDSLTGADILESSLARVPSALVASDSVHAEEATNASKLGGVAANGYMRGEGTVARHFDLLHPGEQSRHYGPIDWFTVSHICPSNVSADPSLFVINRADQKINVFEDNGGTNPVYHELDPTGTGNWFFLSPTAVAGDLTILTASHPDGRVATAYVSTLRRPNNDCLFQLQITVANSEADSM